MSSELRQSLADLIVIQIAPIIEEMESRYPEVTIARAVEARVMTLIEEAVMGNLEVETAIDKAHSRYGEWNYLQTLGSAIDRDSAKEGLARTIGECFADLLGIDLDKLVQEGR